MPKRKINKKNKKKNLKKKGFTLVEVLAVIVIIAILSTGVVYSVSTYLETGKNSYNESLEKQVALSAKSFYPENTSRLPISNGEYDYVTFQELASLKYLDGDVVDADNRNCMNESYVAAEKTEKGLEYTVCLICGEGEDRKSYIEDKEACNKKGPEEETPDKEEDIICKVTGLGNNQFKVTIENATSIKQIEQMGYYKEGEETSKTVIEKALSSNHNFENKSLGNYKFYINEYGKGQKECEGTAVVEKPSNIICKSTTTTNALGTEATTTLTLTNKSENGKDPLDVVTKILRYKNDVLEKTYTTIPSDLKFTSSYGIYRYSVVYVENEIEKETACQGDAVSLTLPNLDLTQKFVPTSSYSTYNGGKISDISGLTNYSSTKWQNGYVYVKINNPQHFNKITVNGTVITNDYFWISKEGDIQTPVVATGKDSEGTKKTKSLPSKLDRKTPAVTIVAKKKTAGTEVASDTWSNQGLNFTLTKGTVGLSGATIYYCKDTANKCTPETTAASGATITSYNATSGTYYIRYKIVGGSGISSSVGSYKAKVDLTAPTVTITAKKKTAGTAVASGKWSNQGLNFTLTQGTKGDSGATIYYCKDTANTCSPGTKITSGTAITSYNTTTGVYYIRYKTVGGSGISSSVGSYKAMVDTTTPTVSISAKKKTAGTAVSTGVWSNQGLNFTLTKGTVGLSGATIYYCKDTANTCSPGTTATSGTAITSYNTTTGTYYIRYKIVGGSGISSTVGSYKARVDTSAPSLTYTNSSNNEWVNTSVTIKATAQDSLSGVDTSSIGYYYRDYDFTNSKWGSWTTAKTTGYWDSDKTSDTTSSGVTTKAIRGRTFSDERRRQMKIEACDNVGNCSVTSVTYVYIDKTAPTISLKNSSGGSWTNSDITVTVTVSEAYKYSTIDESSIKYHWKASGADSYGSYLSQSYWTSITSTKSTVDGYEDKIIKTVVTKKYSGSNINRVFQARACDLAGNCATSSEAKIKQDVTPPTCDSTEFYEIDENDKRRYKYIFKDNLSGVKAERHGHCYAQTSYNKNDTEVLCKTSSAYERLKAKRDAGSWDYTFSSTPTSGWKSYGYVYSEGTVYIYFDVKDAAGNITKCKKFETPYNGTYKHTW